MSNPRPRSESRPRHDGWSAERQLVFLNALSISRNVTKAARAVGMSRESAYRLRARLDGALFAVRWDQILRHRVIVPAPPPPGHESHNIGTTFVTARYRAPPSRS